MDTLVETIEYKNHDIKIHLDMDPINPRTDWDHNNQMICWHGRYNLGDSHNFADPDEFREYAGPDGIILPLYLYDHSGITISTSPFSCQWDSGQVGYIFMDCETLNADYNGDRDHAIRVMAADVQVYDDYLTGSVYGYIVEGPASDSCWGYYGYNHRQSGLLNTAESAIDCFADRPYLDPVQAVVHGLTDIPA